jgi:anthranilate synthase component 1
MMNRASDITPGLEEARALSAGFAAVPVCLTLPESLRDPLELFCLLKSLSKHCFLFESREDPDRWGRYTYLGFDPTAEISCTSGKLRIRNGTTIEIDTCEPGRYIERMLEDYRSPRLEGLPPFTGGLVGYFSYDYLRYSEPEATKATGGQEPSPVDPQQEGFKDVDLMLFDKLIAYDHLEQCIYLIANVRTEALEEDYRRASHELGALATLIAGEQGTGQGYGQSTGQGDERPAPSAPSAPPAAPEPLRLQGPFEQLFDEQRYCDMVERARHYIHEGDIFQVVLSNRLSAPATGSLFSTYQALRCSNPSPYMFYFASDDIELAGSSPETLAKLLDGTVYTFPLAGTRPRGATPAEDAALEQSLLSDEKELAEHNMLVDLGRNDVGRVSAFGTVEVERYLDILRFSHVMHIGSTVKGRLAADKGALDVIDAILPAGTLSGAPKIRACQIINELEGCQRGIYGGAVGYLGFTGNLDTCIAIRLAWLKDGRVFVRSGAGIVADSVAKNEYQECRDKMQAVLDALEATGS